VRRIFEGNNRAGLDGNSLLAHITVNWYWTKTKLRLVHGFPKPFEIGQRPASKDTI
jgi:hypothetical protein